VSSYAVTLNAVQEAAVRLRLARLNTEARNAAIEAELNVPADLTVTDWVQVAVEKAASVVAKEESVALVTLAVEKFSALPPDSQAGLLNLLGLGDVTPAAALRLTGAGSLDLAGVFAALPDEVQGQIFAALGV
jgi:hypothetical protein